MSRLELRPLEADHVGAAGVLLAERHRRHRATQPLLSARYEDVDTATAQVSDAFAKPDASGAVALRGGGVVGYVLGAPRPSDLWGPNVWVEAAGQAVAEAEVIRDLYAVAATRWVDEGRTAHYTIVPASDEELVRMWFRVGFGQQQVHGIRDVPRAIAAPAAQVTVRRATRDDIPVLAQLDLELPLHQSLAPTFSSGPLGTLEENTSEWESDIDDPQYATFVAELNDKVIGSAIGCALERSSGHTGLARPDNAGLLGFASVLPHARGSGVGRALGEAVLAWTVAAGFDCVVTDWRAPNLLASRTWPKLGFVESFLRLHRVIAGRPLRTEL